MKPIITAIAVALCSLSVAGLTGCAQSAKTVPAAAPPAADRPLRVGVYDSRCIAVAYSPSKLHEQEIALLRQQLQEAEAAGNAARVEQLKARGKAMQTIAHMQGFSNAPVDEILAKVQDKLPAVAREVGVDVIVAKLEFHDPGIGVVDVTDRLVALFEPSERTLRTVAELRKHKPITLLDALNMND